MIRTKSKLHQERHGERQSRGDKRPLTTALVNTGDHWWSLVNPGDHWWPLVTTNRWTSFFTLICCNLSSIVSVWSSRQQDGCYKKEKTMGTWYKIKWWCVRGWMTSKKTCVDINLIRWHYRWRGLCQRHVKPIGHTFYNINRCREASSRVVSTYDMVSIYLLTINVLVKYTYRDGFFSRFNRSEQEERRTQSSLSHCSVRSQEKFYHTIKFPGIISIPKESFTVQGK